MRITVALDTNVVTPSPSPFRLKTASIAQIEIQFTRAAVPVLLPVGSGIQFGVKAKGVTSGDPLIYANDFSAVAGHLYVSNVNCATEELATALATSNDFVGEVGWDIGATGLFRSQTFPLLVEAAVVSGGAPTLFQPVRYPVLDGNILHFLRGDGTLAAVSAGGGITLPNPINGNLAYLGNGTWGLPNLATYTGNIGTEQVNAGNIYGTFIGDGSGLTALNPNSFNASNWNGVDIGSNDAPVSSVTAWHFVGRGSLCFEGDGSNLTNVEAISLYLDGGRTFAYSGDDGSGWASSLGITAPFFTGDILNANFNGIALSSFINSSDGTVNNALTAGYANTAGASQFDFNTFFGIGWGTQDIGSVNYPYGTMYANSFVGDGSGLTGLSTPDLSSYTGAVGNSDYWCSNVFANSIEVGDIRVDGSIKLYTAMALPSDAFIGTIFYSRHDGGHFYGFTDDGWKQLDNA